MAAVSAHHTHSPSPESVFGEDSKEHNDVIILIEKATDHFLFKEFCSCIEVCSHAICRTKNFPDCSRCCSCTQNLAVLVIQAYAELNQWDLVLPFVQNVYGNMESCPARVIQLCLLLHAKVKQFVQCHAMAKVWLQYNANSGIDGYTDVAKLYVRQILIPLGAYNLVAQFVEGCSELTVADKQLLLSPVNKSEKEVFRFEKKQSIHCSREVTNEKVSEHGGEVTTGKYSTGGKRLRTIRTLWGVLQKALAHWKDWKVWRMLVMLTLGTMALLHTQFGDSFCGLNRAVKVWEAIIITWNRICGT